MFAVRRWLRVQGVGCRREFVRQKSLLCLPLHSTLSRLIIRAALVANRRFASIFRHRLAEGLAGCGADTADAAGCGLHI